MAFEMYRKVQFSSVQLLSRVRLCDPMDCSTPGFPVLTNSWSLLKLMLLVVFTENYVQFRAHSFGLSRSRGLVSFIAFELFYSSVICR